MVRLGAMLLMIAWLPDAAPAAELHVNVRANDQPQADAVVAVTPLVPSKPLPVTATAAAVQHVIDQRNETFIPYVEVFRPGDTVVFHNSDRTRHHVYSFAPVKPFEFVLASGEDSPPLVLDQIGTIAVGCNIHDRMITHLVVSAAPWTAISDVAGQARLELPPGDYRVEVWHPRVRPGNPLEAHEVQLSADADAVTTLEVGLRLVPDRRQPADRERNPY